MQQVQQAIAEGNSDILELAQQQGLLDEAIAAMPAARSPEDRALAKFMESQKMTSGRPGGTTIEDTRMMNMLNAQRQAEETANLEALRKTQPNVDVGTDPRFGDTMGLQEVLAGDFDPVSDASSKPATPYVPFIPIEPRIGERSIGVGDTFSRAAEAREQGLDMPNPMPPASTDLRGDPGQYGFPQADNIAMGKSIAELDKQLKEIPSELSNVPTDLNPAGFGVQPRYDVDQLPKPVEVGTEADPITMGDAPVGIETARPKAAPVALKAERDAAKLFAPDGGGITTVSTKAINDAAKQSKGLSTDAWLAIAQGGAAMAASKNPTLLGAFGEGAGVAAAGLQKQRAAEKTAGLAQAKIDATLEAARIRAAAAGKGSKLAATGSTLYPAIVGQLEQKELELATETSKGKGSSAAKIDSLTKEIESLRQRKRQIETASGLLVAAGGGGDTKNYDVS
jgi:hypothetical protein